MCVFRNSIFVVALAALLGLDAAATPVLATTSSNSMAVFDSRIAELERKLQEFLSGPASARNSAEFRALVIRIAQLKSFRPNLIRLPEDERRNLIAYLLDYHSKSKRDKDKDKDDDEDEDDED